MTRPAIGIIGGSGLYQMDGVEGVEWRAVDTPFGPPSDEVAVGTVDGVRVAFLARHGRGHVKAPHEIDYRANIWAMKALGVRWLVSVSAVGSMRADIEPGHVVLVDQFIDRTRMRQGTFFQDGLVAHVGFSDPVCGVLREALVQAARDEDIPSHDGGTYVCIEGPQFSTRAESDLYRSWGVSVVGMTNLPEARLAREAQMAYATIALATDYDCWHETEDEVSVEAVLQILRENVAKAQQLLRAVIPRIASLPASDAWSALQYAVITAPDAGDPAARERLSLLLEDTEHHHEVTP